MLLWEQPRPRGDRLCLPDTGYPFFMKEKTQGGQLINHPEPLSN